jgi:aminoglycoside phosphotransferase (APT) family kinase protein
VNAAAAVASGGFAPLHGFDPASEELPLRLQAWLAREWDAPVEVSGWRRFPAGMSWVTVGFRAQLAQERRELILRLGDPAGLFAPYSTEPEFLALTAMADVPGLPIPRVWARCEDSTVLGAPFVITQRVLGDTPTPWDGGGNRDEAERVSLGNDFSDVLGALHGFDWRKTPLAAWAADLTPANSARLETRRWAEEAGHGAPLPAAMHYAMRWLEAHAPVAERIVVVHGDYRVGNFLRQGGRITAVLDWELVHLGDPHEDLAWAGLRAFSPGSKRVGGLVDRDVFHARYTARSGITVDPARLRYHEVLAQFKSSAMLLGASRRVHAGRARDVRMAAMGFQLAPTLMELMRLIEEAR